MDLTGVLLRLKLMVCLTPNTNRNIAIADRHAQMIKSVVDQFSAALRRITLDGEVSMFVDSSSAVIGVGTPSIALREDA